MSLRKPPNRQAYSSKEEVMIPNKLRQWLRRLVDITWNNCTESTQVPATKTADALIDKLIEADGPPPTSYAKPKRRAVQTKGIGPQKALHQAAKSRKHKSETQITPEQEAVHRQITTQRMMDNGV